MFLPFINKKATELELILKIANKYPVLPLSAVLGLLSIHNQYGTDGLNKNIVKFIKDYPSVTAAVQTYVREIIPAGINLEFDLAAIQDYTQFIHIRNELYDESTVETIIHFVFVIQQNDPETFKTVVSDLIDITINPDISVIDTIARRKEIFNEIPQYINLTSVPASVDEIIKFWDEKSLQVELIKTIIADPNKINTYFCSFGSKPEDDRGTTDNKKYTSNRRNHDDVARANGKPTVAEQGTAKVDPSASGDTPDEPPAQTTAANYPEKDSQYPQQGHPYYIDNKGNKVQGRRPNEGKDAHKTKTRKK